MIIVHILAFCLLYVWEVILSTGQLAKLVLSPKPKLNPEFLDVPLDLKGEYAQFLFACLVSMTPGTLSVALNQADGTLLVHWIDCEDPEEAITELKEKIERPLLKIFNT
ncbi:MAG: Na+/H+ antiporter subunit E [Akkermansiaceae bacterium]